MPLSLAGTLKDPYGNPLSSAIIKFDAVATSSSVLQHTSAEATTDTEGGYAIQVEHGRYNIRLQSGRSFYYVARNVLINADTSAADLNELVVDADGYSDLTPQIIIQFTSLRDAARGYRDEAASSAASADEDARTAASAAAATAEDRQQTSADAAKAVSANSSAQAAATTAEAAADAATAAAETAAAIYDSVPDALGATADGAYFKVPENGYLQLYLNTAGAAKPVMRLASEDTLRAIQQLPDPLLTSLLF